MDYQEEFFKEQIRLIHEARIEKEEKFEKIQQEKREEMKSYMENPSSAEDRQFRYDAYSICEGLLMFMLYAHVLFV